MACKIALMEAISFIKSKQVFLLFRFYKDKADSRYMVKTNTECCAPKNKNEVNKNL
jgi:hypothetical protein